MQLRNKVQKDFHIEIAKNTYIISYSHLLLQPWHAITVESALLCKISTFGIYFVFKYIDNAYQ